MALPPLLALCQGEDGLQQQQAWFQGPHNLVLPHASLRPSLVAPQPTNVSGAATQWLPRTLAMAAGLTDPLGSLSEVRLWRVPLWPQPVGL
jgi:hypothetical protein